MRHIGLVLLLCSIAAFSQQSHQHGGPLQPPTAASSKAAASTANRFGTVHFETSCDPGVRSDFNSAVALLHSFEYDEARAAFEQVGKKDPQCAMVLWGVGMSYFHGLWSEYNPAAGTAAVVEAKRIAQANPRTTAREQAFIAALSEMFTDQATHIAQRDNNKPDGRGYLEPPREAEAKYTQRMAELHNAFPDDREATIFYALALNISAKRADNTHADLRQCTSLLNPLFAEMPNHPGIAHYIIHCNDNPEMASAGLDAARKYAQIAPASTHATHMPSHIFAQLGLWQEMVDSNIVSMHSAEEAPDHGSCEKVGNALHAMSFLVVALGETGQLAEAHRIVQHAHDIRTDAALGDRCDDDSKDLVLAAYIMETNDWARGKDIHVSGGANSPISGVMWMTAGVAAARIGDHARAAEAEKQLAALRDARAKLTGQSSENASEALRLALAGVRAQQAGKQDQATDLLRKAADLQDKLGSNILIFKPAREMLADQLAAQGKHAEALAEYKAVLTRQPNRFDSLYGEGSMAFATGDDEHGKICFQKLLEFTRGDERPEMATIRKRATENTVAMQQ